MFDLLVMSGWEEAITSQRPEKVALAIVTETKWKLSLCRDDIQEHYQANDNKTQQGTARN